MLNMLTRHSDLVATILGHPSRMPTRPELAHLHPDELGPRLEELIDSGIVTTVAGDPLPYYRLTNAARALIDDQRLFDPDIRRTLYEQVEKPSEVRRLEALPRPNE